MIEHRKVLSALMAVAIVAALPAGAADDSMLRAVRGTVGYELTKDAPFTRVFGSFAVTQDEFALTRAASNGLLVLPDSSEVALGGNTTVQVGQITQAATDTPNALTLVAGSVRFEIKHPAGGRANYRFLTSTSQLAVRGTVGLYSTGPNGDVVTCLDCAPGDVTVTAGTNTVALVTGQTAFISIAGIVTVAATTAAVAGVFTSTGLSSIAGSTTPFATGVASAAGAAAGAGAAGGIAAGAAAAAAVTAGVTAHTSTVSTTPVNNTQSGTGLVSSHATRPPDSLVPQTIQVPAPSAPTKH